MPSYIDIPMRVQSLDLNYHLGGPLLYGTPHLGVLSYAFNWPRLNRAFYSINVWYCYLTFIISKIKICEFQCKNKPKIDGQRNLTSNLETYKFYFLKIFFQPKTRRFPIFQKKKIQL